MAEPTAACIHEDGRIHLDPQVDLCCEDNFIFEIHGVDFNDFVPHRTVSQDHEDEPEIDPESTDLMNMPGIDSPPDQEDCSHTFGSPLTNTSSGVSPPITNEEKMKSFP